MTISLRSQGGFLKIVGRHPFRFILGACTLGLCVLCGVSSSLLFHGQAAAQLPSLAALPHGVTALWRAMLCAIAWQTMLTSAVCYGKNGGSGAAVALFAFGLEGFTYGFALSELLFSYGERGVPALALSAALCGMMGIVLRLYWFLRDEETFADAKTPQGRRGVREPIRFVGRLAFLALLQGGCMPLLFHLLNMD